MEVRMSPVVLWLCLGVAVGLVSLIWPHGRRGSTSALHVVASIVGALLGGWIGRSAHAGLRAHPSGLGAAFTGAILFALISVWAQARFAKRVRA
jgi:uncharacterized membrane protein YeaQ/YmgE (transglycosylase-associated protein family)